MANILALVQLPLKLMAKFPLTSGEARADLLSGEDKAMKTQCER